MASHMIFREPSKHYLPLLELGLQKIEVAAEIACVDRFLWSSASSRAKSKAMH